MKNCNKTIDTLGIVQEIKNKFKYLNINEVDFNSIVETTLIESKKEFKGSCFNDFKTILTKKLTTAILEYEKDISYSKDEYEEENAYEYEINSYMQYIKDISDLDLLSTVQFQELFMLYKKGSQKARDTLILRNLRLVIEVANQFQDRGLDILDLIEEGNLGLIKALEHYDITRGCPFSTYALIWINQSIRRAIALKTRNIKLPMLPYLQVNKFLSTKIKLTMKLGREPLRSEIASKLNISIEKVRELELLQHDTVSLNSEYMILDDVEDNNFHVVEVIDMIVDETSQVEETIIANVMKESVSKIFDNCNLSERQKEVLYYRFGLYDKKQCAYEELKDIFGLSKERIRQIAESALLKLRRSNHTKKLAVFMDNPEQALLYLNKYQKVKKKKKL